MVFSDEVKKIISIVKTVLFCAFLVLIYVICSYSDTHYKRTGWIQTTNIKGEFEFVDSKGNVWSFIDDELLIPSNVPVEAVVKMHTNGTTDYIKDDIILDYSFQNKK